MMKQIQTDPRPELQGTPIDDEIRKVDGKSWMYSEFSERWERTDQPAGEPGVRCGKCGNSVFTARYGTYRVVATCLDCGHQFDLYSG